METTPSKLYPALIGGAVLGILSSVPLLKEGNCLCCIWIITGGVLAAFLYWRAFPAGSVFSLSQGATVGLLAGLYGGLFTTLLSYFFEIMGLDPTRAVFESMIELQGDYTAGFDDFFKTFEDGSAMEPIYAITSLFFNVIRGILFGTLGGVLGGAMIGKKVKCSPSAKS